MTEPIVYVVDDDKVVCKAIAMLVKSTGRKVMSYHSAEDFLKDLDPTAAGCIVLDVRMPGISGLALQEKLGRMGVTLPIIMISGQADIPMAVNAVKKGAVNFLKKPFTAKELLDSIDTALAVDMETRSEKRAKDEYARRTAELTRRERQILELMVDGKPNKAIASELNLSQKTIEYHRSQIMKKMRARSLPELVRWVVSQKVDVD